MTNSSSLKMERAVNATDGGSSLFTTAYTERDTTARKMGPTLLVEEHQYANFCRIGGFSNGTHIQKNKSNLNQYNQSLKFLADDSDNKDPTYLQRRL